jgi:3-methyl-2-oxobutanoate hydroxymethyltransferase
MSDTQEVSAPYGSGAAAQGKPAKRVRIHHLREMKSRGEHWPMLTAYDMYTAELFDEAGIPVLLVGDSASNNVYGYDTSLPVTVDELMPLVAAVSRAAKRALVVADLPFGSYQLSPEQALATAVRFMKEGRAHAVKLEGGSAFAPHVKAITTAGVPVMGHIGFTPQSEHNLGGYRVQGRGDTGDQVLADALALQEAGAFAVVMEMVPAEASGRARTATGRCWSGRTWRACAGRSRRASSSATRTWRACCSARPATSPRTCAAASSPARSTCSTRPRCSRWSWGHPVG